MHRCTRLLVAASAFAGILSVPAQPAHPVPYAHLSRHPVVALTFDDLPSAGGLAPGETRVGIVTRLAAELRAAHLEGTYGFVIGSDLEDDDDAQQALRIWLDAGMNIGNHTWSHPSLTTLTAPAYERDIARNEPTLQRYAGHRNWHWFRYPYLDEGDTVAKRDSVRAWLQNHGYRIAQVTLTFQDDDFSDPYDRCTAQHNDAAIAWLKQSYMENVAEFIRLGREEQRLAFGREIPNVLLLHATRFTTLMLPSLLDLLHQQGFRFASLESVLSDSAYSLDPHAGVVNGGPFQNLFLNARHLKYPPFKPEPTEQLDSLCR